MVLLGGKGVTGGSGFLKLLLMFLSKSRSGLVATENGSLMHKGRLQNFRTPCTNCPAWILDFFV